MENTFSTCRKAFRSSNQHQAFVTLKDLFQNIGDISYWTRKIQEIQWAVFDHEIDFEKCPPDSMIYSGQLTLKIIYSRIHLQEFPEIQKKDLVWEHMADSWIQSMFKKQSENLTMLQLMEHLPKALSAEEVLNPSAFLRKFYLKHSLKKWIRRWNQFREMAFYSYSIFDGDEGEYLEDFNYFLKLTEACYLIHSRYSPIQTN
ncbi:hypothetical protein [uncultured Algoriphagus sp.]|uniref:hypothetical protein n=1 Tax=uncultured Algoriphagus sp. TaxID=417365 RepID=UPI0030ED9E99|tara:strand:- start:128090 stop:128695 length:606 start_codon:yes stop_codon:yes gene_type:complete